MKTIKIIIEILGGLAILAGIFVGLYVGLYLCCIGGVIQAVHGFQTTPINASDIAVGAVRVFCASIAGWSSFIICTVLGGGLIAFAKKLK